MIIILSRSSKSVSTDCLFPKKNQVYYVGYSTCICVILRKQKRRIYHLIICDSIKHAFQVFQQWKMINATSSKSNRSKKTIKYDRMPVHFLQIVFHK